MAIATEVANDASVSSMPPKYLNQKVKSLRDISQIKHINRIRRCAEKNSQTQQGKINKGKNSVNPSNLNAYDSYHLNSSSSSKSSETEGRKFNSEIKISTEYELKFQEHFLKSLKPLRYYSCSSIPILSMIQQSIICHSNTYDIHQLKHIKRIRSIGNMPVSFVFHKPITQETELNGMNYMSGKCPYQRHEGDSSERVNLYQKKASGEQSSVLETENDFINNILIHFKTSSKKNKDGNRKNTQRIHEENYEKKIMEGRSRCKDLMQESKNKITNNKQKYNGSRIPSNLENYRDNTASKLRKSMKSKQYATSDSENFQFFSKSFRTRNDVIKNELLQTENKTYLNKEDYPSYMINGNGDKLEIMEPYRLISQPSERSINKRKTWAYSIWKDKEINSGVKRLENQTLTKGSSIPKEDIWNKIYKFGDIKITEEDNDFAHDEFRNSFRKIFVNNSPPKEYYPDQGNSKCVNDEFESGYKKSFTLNSLPEKNCSDKDDFKSEGFEENFAIFSPVEKDCHDLEVGKSEDNLEENFAIDNSIEEGCPDMNGGKSENYFQEIFAIDSPAKKICTEMDGDKSENVEENFAISSAGEKDCPDPSGNKSAEYFEKSVAIVGVARKECPDLDGGKSADGFKRNFKINRKKIIMTIDYFNLSDSKCMNNEFKNVFKENFAIDSLKKPYCHTNSNFKNYMIVELENIFEEVFIIDSSPTEDYSNQRPVFTFPNVKIVELFKEIKPDYFYTK